MLKLNFPHIITKWFRRTSYEVSNIVSTKQVLVTLTILTCFIVFIELTLAELIFVHLYAYCLSVPLTPKMWGLLRAGKLFCADVSLVCKVEADTQWALHNEQGANVRESIESFNSGPDPQTVAVFKH